MEGRNTELDLKGLCVFAEGFREFVNFLEVEYLQFFGRICIIYLHYGNVMNFRYRSVFWINIGIFKKSSRCITSYDWR